MVTMKKRRSNFFAPILRRIADSKDGVEDVTLDLTGPGGLARLHQVPPAFSLLPRPSMLVINGNYRISLSSFQAHLVRNFMRTLKKSCKQGEEISPEQVQVIVNRSVEKTGGLFGETTTKERRSQLEAIMEVVIALARNEKLPDDFKSGITNEQWRKIARGPGRLDLIIAALTVDGHPICPNDCGICFANTPAMSFSKEELLTEDQWIRVIRKARQIGIPELTFTGGEATTQKFLIELIKEAEWAVTRLNTMGGTLTAAYCKQLVEAQLDTVQITLYSNVATVHDELVGRPGAHIYTVNGIRNAVAAGLNVSINVPLVAANVAGFNDTIAFAKSLGVRYVTCSGLIPTGNAPKVISRGDALDHDQLLAALTSAKKFANDQGVELQFTSPGQLGEDEVAGLGMDVPTCGACFSNMAVMPNGEVVRCQSDLGSKKGLGNILTTPWWFIWNRPACKRVRDLAALLNFCMLKK